MASYESKKKPRYESGKKAQYELEDGNRVQKALSIIVRDQSTGNRNNNLAIIESSGIFFERPEIIAVFDLEVRSSFQVIFNY